MMLPTLFAIDEASSIDIAAMTLVVKKIDPNFPSSILNLSLKKKVTHDLPSGQQEKWGYLR